MSSWKHISSISAALIPLIIGGCCENMATRPYQDIPYCCDRTAGTGIELYCAEPEKSAAIKEQAPTTIEPAAGDEVFHKAIQK